MISLILLALVGTDPLIDNSGSNLWFDTKSLATMGIPVSNSPNKYWGEISPYTISYEQRFWIPKYSPLELSVAFTAPYGVETNLLINIFHCQWLKIHTTTGLMLNIFEPSSVPQINRQYDIVLGFGADVNITKKIWLFTGIKSYLPNFSTIGTWGGYSFPIYKEALAESRFYFGFGIKL